jgi:cyclohexanone monooxygenase
MLDEHIDLAARLNLDFDPVSLKEKYLLERDKRMRPEANRHYVKAAGDLRGYLDDGAARQRPERAPKTLDLEVLVIGGGFTGLQTAYYLHTQGISNFHIIDRCPDFGGNWYYNRYPGAACDTESYVYLPLLEETDYIPTRRFVDAEEIFQHARRIGRTFDLYERSTFHTEVTSLVWDDAASHWTVGTDHGDIITARFVVLSTGETFSAIKLPDIEGITSFQGSSFHTARWDYGITGGDVHGGLDKLKGKKVAIIGTGCSSIQIVPHLAETADEVYVIQRTPQMIDPRGNRPTDPEWVKSLTPGWQDRRNYQLIGTIEGREVEPYEDSGFLDLTVELTRHFKETSEAATAAGLELSLKTVLEVASMKYMEGMRNRIGSLVEDPVTAEALKPYYSNYCKRPAWSDTYIQSFNRPNVHLVDAPCGVDRVTEKGLVANGVEYDVDIIVYGSGYEFAYSSIFQIARFPIVGRDGVTLEEHWKDAYRSFQGALMHHFPNYFQQSFVGSGVGANYLYGSGKQSEHIAWLIRHCLDERVDVIEATREAEDEWRRTVEGTRRPTAHIVSEFIAECTPGYMNVDGNFEDPKAVRNNTFGGGILAFAEYLEAYRKAGTMDGLSLTRHYEMTSPGTSD